MSTKKMPRVNRETMLLLVELQKQTGRNLNFAALLSECFERNYPEGGTLQGTPRRIAGLIGWDVATVAGLYKRLIALPGGGNAALRARTVEDAPGEICFYSEAVENSLKAIRAKSESRELSKERKRAARESGKSTSQQSTPPGRTDSGAQAVPVAPEVAKNKDEVLEMIEREANRNPANYRLTNAFHEVNDAPEDKIPEILAKYALNIQYKPGAPEVEESESPANVSEGLPPDWNFAKSIP